MQLTGTQFTRTAAVFGNDISTLPDFPAEIRAPAGSLPGVSGFQISFSSNDIHTPGRRAGRPRRDEPGSAQDEHRRPAARAARSSSTATPSPSRTSTRRPTRSNPLTDGSLKQSTVFEVPISTLNERSLDGLDMTSKQKDLTKNFFALGIMFWLYERSMEPTIHWIDQKFAARPVVAEANKRALKAGYAFGETTEIFHTHYRVKPAHLPPGHVSQHHRQRGDGARLPDRVAAGRPPRCSTAATRSRPPATSSTSSPATRRSASRRSRPRTRSRPSAPRSARATAGRSGMTASSGPGIALKTEAMGLAVMVELPLVVIDVQRAGPSTGMPTKNEQADLLQVMFGRNSDSPIPIVAPATPGDCFDMAIEAWRHRAQVHDAGRLPVGRVPRDRLRAVADPGARRPAGHRRRERGPRARDRSSPYQRDPETLARPWAVPGTAGLEHRIGGLEKADVTGNVSYDPDNHHRMQLLRAAKVAGIANDIPPLDVFGPATRRPAHPRLGLDLWRDPLARSSACSAEGGPSPTPTCATSTRSRRTPRRSCARTAGSSSRRSTSGQLLMLVRAKYLIDADRLRPRPRQAVPHRRDRDRGRADPRGVTEHDRHQRARRRRRPSPAAAEPRERGGHRR